jgi:hypothetical protein
MKPGRIPCLVPFCRRTGKRTSDAADEEIICGPHFRLADKSKRRRLSKLYRAWARAAELSKRKYLLTKLWWRQWEAIKVQAIERAMGVTG